MHLKVLQRDFNVKLTVTLVKFSFPLFSCSLTTLSLHIPLALEGSGSLLPHHGCQPSAPGTFLAHGLSYHFFRMEETLS